MEVSKSNLQLRFRFSWVLQNSLAVGPAPKAIRHLDRLTDAGIKSILSLCSNAEVQNQEAGLLEVLDSQFSHQIFVLPDHRSGKPPTMTDFLHALELADNLLQNSSPLYIHCVASVERSPLLCMGILIRRNNISPLSALDYMQQTHPGTNPLPQQLALLNGLIL